MATVSRSPVGRLVLRGGGSGTKKYVYHKWPDQISPIANFVFSHDGPFGMGRGGGGPPCSSLLIKPMPACGTRGQ